MTKVDKVHEKVKIKVESRRQKASSFNFLHAAALCMSCPMKPGLWAFVCESGKSTTVVVMAKL